VKRALALAVLCVACRREKATPADAAPSARRPPSAGDVLVGQGALGDARTDAPGLRRKISASDLPAPNATESVENPPKVVPRPANAWPKVPPRFKVDLYAEDLSGPRMARVAPNGDLFVVESHAGRVRVLRDGDAGGRIVDTFASGLSDPFGIAWLGDHVYIANTGSIVRFPYRDGDTVARGPAEVVYGGISGGGRLPGGGHWTRDIVFSRDGTKLFLSVGSRSNVSDHPNESRRARIFELSADGKSERVYADGIRNAVGLAIHPDTGELWASVNERDELGDDLVPDYITSVKDGGFYGWPWFYIGPHEDPRHAGKHPELKARVLVPDVLVQSHSASLGMTFITAASWPHRGSALAAQHGSWNRSRRTGYKVILVPLENGRALGEYVDFMTGFVTPGGDVWGRPVAVTQRADGSLFVTDDGGHCVWRVTYL
jgi:glucose/arabinose dehydrogenase